MSQSAIPTSPIFELDIDEQKLVVDKKREQDSSHKWALGIRDGHGSVPHPPNSLNTPHQRWDVSARDHGIRDDIKAQMKIRPVLPWAKHQFERRENQRGRTDSSRAAKAVDKDVFDSSESSANEESAAPAPDAGITYSFDAARGPSAGSDILSLAVNKAVERFENKVTEKLVKDEYDVVVPEDDRAVERNAGYAADDEDFEFV